jgi:hypothetical protein
VVRRFKRNADKSWTVTLADADNRRQKFCRLAISWRVISP